MRPVRNRSRFPCPVARVPLTRRVGAATTGDPHGRLSVSRLGERTDPRGDRSNRTDRVGHGRTCFIEKLPCKAPDPNRRSTRNLAEVAQALGHAHRLELLEHLAQGERGVEELAARSRLSFANTSRHLQILRRARLVETERRGKHVLYNLAGDAEVVTLIRTLGRVGSAGRRFNCSVHSTSSSTCCRSVERTRPAGTA